MILLEFFKYLIYLYIDIVEVVFIIINDLFKKSKLLFVLKKIFGNILMYYLIYKIIFDMVNKM